MSAAHAGSGELTAGVIGAGQGGMLSVRALQASGNYRLVGVADSNESARTRAASQLPGVEVYPDAGSLLSALQPSVVCVSTFAPSHPDVARQALQAGARGLLVEKPIALTWRLGRDLFDLLASQHVPAVVPHGLLVRNASAEVLRRVLDGEIGQVEVIEIESGGWDLISAGIHWVDFALAALGDDRPESVFCACDVTGQTYRDGIEVETEAVTYCVMRSGARIVMQTGDHVKPSREGKELVFRIYGDQGSIEFWGWEDRYCMRGGKAGASEIVEVAPAEQTAHQVYLDRLAEMVVGGAPDFELAELSLRALEVCEAAYLSAAQRCNVRLPIAGFTAPQLVEWAPGTAYRGKGGRDGRH